MCMAVEFKVVTSTFCGESSGAEHKGKDQC